MARDKHRRSSSLSPDRKEKRRRSRSRSRDRDRDRRRKRSRSRDRERDRKRSRSRERKERKRDKDSRGRETKERERESKSQEADEAGDSRVSGVTSSNSSLSVTSDYSPPRMPPWTAAPYATASSGLMPLFGSLPLKKSLIIC